MSWNDSEGSRDGVARVATLAAALALDLAFRELPTRWHPVGWMGRLASRLESRAPREGLVSQLAFGTGAEVLCLAVAVAPGALLERALRRIPVTPRVVLTALALKPAFSARSLFSSVLRVRDALKRGDLPAARLAVGEIVSRDTESLDESGVAAAAVESLAENSGDSVVAPLLYYALLGLPGAFGYRMANTLDAMWGYRGHYEYLGKAAARLDDLLNVVPSRLAALAMAAGCWLSGESARNALSRSLGDASLTASPNAGWPMAAMAGGLKVRLEKRDHYVLNPRGADPGAEDIGRAARVAGAGLAVAAGFLALLALRSRDGDRG